MKTKLLLTFSVLVLAGYAAFITTRVGRLEDRLSKIESARIDARAPVVAYSFDDAFVQYHGQKGVDAVKDAAEILNSLPSSSRTP